MLDGVQAGDEVLVYADVPEGQAVRVAVGGVDLARARPHVRVERPLLERSWARAKIQSLLDGAGDDPKADVVRQVIALSTAHRVLSPYTSLLVLETEADFARFRLDRKALADVLTVDGGKLAVAKRSAPSPLGGNGSSDALTAKAERQPPVLRPPPHAAGRARAGGRGQLAAAGDPQSARGNMWGSNIGESFGAGGLGLAGKGEGGGGRGEGIGLGSVGTVGHGASVVGSGQGFGSGHGRLGGAHRTKPPQVRMGATQVSGRIPPEVIQRIVRQNFGRVRACYEEGLRVNPGTQGRVAVRFVIGRDGSVVQASAIDPGEVGPSVATCIARSMYALSFPAPDGGVVMVVYPFTLTPEDGSPPARSRTLARLPPIDVPPAPRRRRCRRRWSRPWPSDPTPSPTPGASRR